MCVCFYLIETKWLKASSSLTPSWQSFTMITLLPFALWLIWLYYQTWYCTPNPTHTHTQQCLSIHLSQMLQIFSNYLQVPCSGGFSENQSGPHVSVSVWSTFILKIKHSFTLRTAVKTISPQDPQPPALPPGALHHIMWSSSTGAASHAATVQV